jgi:hypothetical protein
MQNFITLQSPLLGGKEPKKREEKKMFVNSGHLVLCRLRKPLGPLKIERMGVLALAKSHQTLNLTRELLCSTIESLCWGKDLSKTSQKERKHSASADRGPCSRVCARETLHSTPHWD